MSFLTTILPIPVLNEWLRDLCISPGSLSGQEANPGEKDTGQHQEGELQDVPDIDYCEDEEELQDLQYSLVGWQVEDLPGKSVNVDAEGEDKDDVHDENQEHGDNSSHH